MGRIAQNRPGSNLNGLVRVWLHSSGLEASRCAGIIGPGFWQNAISPLPVSRFQTRFRSSTDVPDNTEQNQPGSDLVLADCVRFWPNGSGPEASQCAKNHPARFWPMLPSRSGPDVNRIRHVYWVFTIFLFFISLFVCGYVVAFSLGFQTGIRQTYQKLHGALHA